MHHWVACLTLNCIGEDIGEAGEAGEECPGSARQVQQSGIDAADMHVFPPAVRRTSGVANQPIGLGLCTWISHPHPRHHKAHLVHLGLHEEPPSLWGLRIIGFPEVPSSQSRQLCS